MRIKYTFIDGTCTNVPIYIHTSLCVRLFLRLVARVVCGFCFGLCFVLPCHCCPKVVKNQLRPKRGASSAFSLKCFAFH